MPNPRIQKKAQATISRASNRPAAKPMSKPAAGGAASAIGKPVDMADRSNQATLRQVKGDAAGMAQANPAGVRGVPGGGAAQAPAPPQLQSMQQAIQAAGGDPSGGAIAKPFPGAGGSAPDMPGGPGMGMGAGMAGAPPGAPPMLPPRLMQAIEAGRQTPESAAQRFDMFKQKMLPGQQGPMQPPGAGGPSAPMQSAPAMPGAPPTLQGPPMPPRPGAEPAMPGMPPGMGNLPQGQGGAQSSPMLPPALTQMLQQNPGYFAMQGKPMGAQGGPQGFAMQMPGQLPGAPQGPLDPKQIMDANGPPPTPQGPQQRMGGQGLAGQRMY
jgi:hypothetical protein